MLIVTLQVTLEQLARLVIQGVQGLRAVKGLWVVRVLRVLRGPAPLVPQAVLGPQAQQVIRVLRDHRDPLDLLALQVHRVELGLLVIRELDSLSVHLVLKAHRGHKDQEVTILV